MTKQWSPKGECLCGRIKVKLNDIKPEIGVCHCKMCRQWAGNSYMSIEADQRVDIEGEEHLQVFESSEWAERGFCQSCGTHIFYRLKKNQAHYLPVGLFEDSDLPELDHEIFIDLKPKFYNFAENTKKLTSAEVAAFFGGDSD